MVFDKMVLLGTDSLGRDSLVVEGRSWKRWSSGGGTVLGKRVLWWRDGLGKDGLVGGE
jgi:hypothetical protein